MTTPPCTLLIRCPLCAALTPAHAVQVPGEPAPRIGPCICLDCWVTRRAELTALLRVAVAWYRAKAIAGQYVAEPFV